jgi:hypothetical protein
MISKKHTLTIFSLIILAASLTQAKSVYVISDTKSSELQAYEIQDANLIWQVNYVCEFDPPGVTGSVGLAIDESEYGEFLFVTFEGSDKIELVNAKTMIFEQNPVVVPNASNLAGIALNSAKKNLN